MDNVISMNDWKYNKYYRINEELQKQIDGTNDLPTLDNSLLSVAQTVALCGGWNKESRNIALSIIKRMNELATTESLKNLCQTKIKELEGMKF